MSPDNKRRLHTPQGAEAVYLEEACRHRKLLRLTEDHFTSWGYQPALTPVFDYYETYRSLLDHAQLERIYRFPDRDGELLMLRSDVTLFLAKQMGLVLKSDESPVRVYYADSILRHQSEEDISNDEFFQVGGELIGLSGCDGDLEILMLLHDLLTELQLPKWRMHIGSRQLTNRVLGRQGDTGEAGKLMETRDKAALIKLLARSGLSAPESRADLLFFLGTPDEFAGSWKKLTSQCGESSNNGIAEAAEELVSLAVELTQIVSQDSIRIDLSEHGDQPYYTGFTVKAYVEGVSTAVASGGRYDNLSGIFGTRLPAAGFSLLTRKIEPLSIYASAVSEDLKASKARGVDFIQRYRDAENRRKNGEKVTLS